MAFYIVYISILIVLFIGWCVRKHFKHRKQVATAAVRPRPPTGASTNVQSSSVYTIQDDPLADDPRGFPDFFWNVSPQTSGSRDAIHKDDKDLPSYEEVMQMEMRQQVVGTPTTVVALPAPTAAGERAATTNTVPVVATASV